MPRTKTTPPPAAPAVNSVVASAAQVTSRKRIGVPKNQGTGGWQHEAWDMLDLVGELEFYRLWISNALSRVKLYVQQELATGDTVRLKTGGPVEALDQLFDGEEGQAQMLAQLAGLLGIPGEAWLVGLLEPSDQADGPDMWRVVSNEEIKLQTNKWVIDRGDGDPETYDDGSGDTPAGVYVARIWRPHPKKWVEAHSAVRSALPILRELLGLTKHVAATIDSRLAGAGILVVPQEATFSAPGVVDAAVSDPTDPTADPLLASLIQTMVTAIQDRGDVSAVAPILLKVPAAYVDKVKHITFATAFSGEAQALRTEAITRLANSLDVPAEVLTGMADVNHWTGWLLDESAIKMHVEPLVALICHALTTRYLWPALQGSAPTLDPAIRAFTLQGDTSALRQRPNHSAEAGAAHDNLTITDAAWAREVGFEEDDLLDTTTDEFKRRLLVKLTQSHSVDVVVAALSEFGITVEVPGTAVTKTAAPAVDADPLPIAAPDTGAPAQPDTPPAAAPATAALQAAALMASAEPVVLRAVERAWNKAGKRSRAGRRPIDSAELDACLAGAWDYLPSTAALLGLDRDRLTDVCDTYTRALLVTGADHNRRELAAALTACLRPVPLAIG